MKSSGRLLIATYCSVSRNKVAYARHRAERAALADVVEICKPHPNRHACAKIVIRGAKAVMDSFARRAPFRARYRRARGDSFCRAGRNICFCHHARHRAAQFRIVAVWLAGRGISTKCSCPVLSQQFCHRRAARGGRYISHQPMSCSGMPHQIIIAASENHAYPKASPLQISGYIEGEAQYVKPERAHRAYSAAGGRGIKKKLTYLENDRKPAVLGDACEIIGPRVAEFLNINQQSGNMRALFLCALSYPGSNAAAY